MALPVIRNPSRVNRACIFPSFEYTNKKYGLLSFAKSHNVTLSLKDKIKISRHPPYGRLVMKGSPQDVDSMEEWIYDTFVGDDPECKYFKYGVYLPVDNQLCYSLRRQSGQVKDILSQTSTSARKDHDESVWIAGHFTEI